MSTIRSDLAAWRSARTLAHLGELTALWLEGKITSVPGYHGGPDDETLPLVPVLARLNRAGFVTICSQPACEGPGHDGAKWQQRAAVEGFTDSPALIERISQAIRAHGMRAYGIQVIAYDPATLPRRRFRTDREMAVTMRDGEEYTWFGQQIPRREIRDREVGWGALRRDAVKALCNAWQVTVIDPQWGREALLWDVLDGALSRAGGVVMTALLVADFPGAACTDADPLLFFAPEAETVKDRKTREGQARSVCARCPAIRDCLEWAMATGQEDGIWGGVEFGTYYGPLCRNKLHLMDAGNTWIDTHGSTKCRACRNIADQRDRARRARDDAARNARNARDRERYADRRKQQQEEEKAA